MKIFINAPFCCHYCRQPLVASKAIIGDVTERLLSHAYTEEGHCPYDGCVISMPMYEVDPFRVKLARPEDK